MRRSGVVHKVSVALGPDKGRVFTLTGPDPVTIGRRAAHLLLKDHNTSRLHAQFFIRQKHWWLVDLGSTNGTMVNGQKVTQPVRLKVGDQIQMGRSILVYQGAAVPATQHRPTPPPSATGRQPAASGQRPAPTEPVPLDPAAFEALTRVDRTPPQRRPVRAVSQRPGSTPPTPRPNGRSAGRPARRAAASQVPKPQPFPMPAAGAPTPETVADGGDDDARAASTPPATADIETVSPEEPVVTDTTASAKAPGPADGQPIVAVVDARDAIDQPASDQPASKRETADAAAGASDAPTGDSTPVDESASPHAASEQADERPAVAVVDAHEAAHSPTTGHADATGPAHDAVASSAERADKAASGAATGDDPHIGVMQDPFACDDAGDASAIVPEQHAAMTAAVDRTPIALADYESQCRHDLADGEPMVSLLAHQPGLAGDGQASRAIDAVALFAEPRVGAVGSDLATVDQAVLADTERSDVVEHRSVPTHTDTSLDASAGTAPVVELMLVDAAPDMDVVPDDVAEFFAVAIDVEPATELAEPDVPEPPPPPDVVPVEGDGPEPMAASAAEPSAAPTVPAAWQAGLTRDSDKGEGPIAGSTSMLFDAERLVAEAEGRTARASAPAEPVQPQSARPPTPQARPAEPTAPALMHQEAELPIEPETSPIAWEERQRQVTRWKLITGVLVFLVVFVLASQVMIWLRAANTKPIDDRTTDGASAAPSPPPASASTTSPDESASSKGDDEPKSSEERTAAILRAMREHAEADAADSTEKDTPEE